MPTVSITPPGPFSLAASIRFLDSFTPAAYRDAADGLLRMAFPSDDGGSVIGVAVRQDAPDATVAAEYSVRPGPGGEPAAAAAVQSQVARILSLDVDGSGFPALGAADPVVASLQAEYPGLRPVLFYSPYEAAAWTVIGNRIRMSQAAAIKARIGRDHGTPVEVAGQTVHAFPAPGVLRELGPVPGLNDVKAQRLRALADAALDGRLDAAALRAQPADAALAALRELPGIGPFSAELVLIRGAGHPDIFPRHEARVHQAIAAEYGLGPDADGDLGRLAEIADGWRPYRSWVGLLLRARMAEQRAGAGAPAPAR
jgi:DNA-3-methyladenine glycosylase II